MSFDSYLRELADPRRPLRIGRLAHLSDLPTDDLEAFKTAWATFPSERRVAILGQLNDLGEDDFELDFREIFRMALRDPDAEVRRRALMGLWQEDDPKLIDPIIWLLRTDPDVDVRAAAATGLGGFVMMAELDHLSPAQSERVVDSLLEQISDPDQPLEVRRRAIEALGALSDERVTRIIEQAYHSSEEKMRISAVFAMGRNCEERWLPTLLKELRSENPEMRYEAVGAAGEMEDAAIVPDLLPLLQDDDLEVRLATATALGHIGGPVAQTALRRAANSDDDQLRDAAEAALEEIALGDDPIRLD